MNLSIYRYIELWMWVDAYICKGLYLYILRIYIIMIDSYPIVIHALYIGPFSTAVFKRQKDFSTRFRCGFKHGRWNITLVLMGK